MRTTNDLETAAIMRNIILEKMVVKTENIRSALQGALRTWDTENICYGCLASIGTDLEDLKALADALVALRR